MGSSSIYKKLINILTVLFIAIIFFTSAVSCKLIDPGTEIMEETGENPVTEITESDEPDTDKQDTDGGQTAIENKEEDIAVKIWIEDLIPEEIASGIFDFLKDDPGVEIVDYKEQAQAVLEILPAGAIPAGPDTYEDLEIYYIMAPVVSFTI